MSERRADGPVSLSRNGHHHEDGCRNAETLERVQEIGKGQSIPERLREAFAADEHAHDAVVQDVVDQEHCVNDG